MISADADEIIAMVPALAAHRATLAGRAMLCRRTEVFPGRVRRARLSLRLGVEGVQGARHARRRAAAAGPARERAARAADLQPGDEGRDGARREHHDRAGWREIVGADAARELERLSRLVYERGRDIAAQRGIIIADTKFEFGRAATARIMLIDEVLTPDSSRFWPAESLRARPRRSRASTSSRCATISTGSGARPLERRGAAAAAAADVVRRDERALSRCVSPHHRIDAEHSRSSA